MDNLHYIGQMVEVKMDRPLGSRHPKFNFVYEQNYGYVPNTVSGDGEELDAYVVGVNEPLESYYGKVIAIINRIEEDDDKLVVTYENKNFTDEEIEKMVNFQEKWKKHRILR